MYKSFNKLNNSNLKLPFISYKFYYFLIFLIFIISIMALMIHNFIHLWIIMEINTLMFISLMALNSKSFKATFNFFIIQSVSSLMLIILFIVESNFSSYFFFNFLLLMTFLMKLGLFPFFFWPPLINMQINWMLIFIMSTSQKIIPLLMINQYINLNNNNNQFLYLIILSALMSSFISTIMNYNETNFKKIMTFSSTNHLSWMILILLFDSSLFLTYFIIYSLTMIFMCLIFNKLNISSFNDLIKISFFNNKKIYFIITLNFLIISALPPFLTFIIKMNSIKILIENNSMISSLLLTMTSIFTLIFYMNIIIKMNMFSMIKTKFFYNQLSNLKSNFLSVISISFFSLIFMFFLFNSIH